MRNAEELKSNRLKETINHMIDNRPYSIHKTEVAESSNPVLYQHWHDEIELFYLEQGEIELIIEDQSFSLKKGEAILIPPNLLHLATKTNLVACSFYALVFSPILFTESFTNAAYSRFVRPLNHNGPSYICKFSPSYGWQNQVLESLKRILQFYNRKDIDVWELELHGLLYQLWNLYYLNHMESIALSSNYVKLYDKLKLSLTYIHENFSSDITVALLAQQSGLCIGTFCRYFKELTGLTPFTYLTRYRIRKSCESLLTTKLKVTQIAFLCGFNNMSYFNRCFLQHVKCKPSEYRKQNT